MRNNRDKAVAVGWSRHEEFERSLGQGVDRFPGPSGMGSSLDSAQRQKGPLGPRGREHGTSQLPRGKTSWTLAEEANAWGVSFLRFHMHAGVPLPEGKLRKDQKIPFV